MKTVYSERLAAHLPLGKLEAKPISGATHMDEVVRILHKQGASLPALRAFNHAVVYSNGSILQGGWGMGGNGPCDDNTVPANWAAFAGAGDCGLAAPGHEHMMEHKLSGNPGTVTFSCKTSLMNYTDFTGWATPGQAYDPVTGANDSGVVISDVITYRQQAGILDDQGVMHKIGHSVELTPGDLQHLWLASMLFQKVNFGLMWRSNNTDEFDNGQPLTYSKSATDEGGHDIFNCGYVLDGGPMGRAINWGEDNPWRRPFYIRQCDEAVTYISKDMYRTVTGRDSDGYADQDLELYLSNFVQMHGIVEPRITGFWSQIRNRAAQIEHDIEEAV